MEQLSLVNKQSKIMKQKFVKDLQFKDRLTEELFAVKSVKMGKTMDGRDYADVMLSDKTGEVSGKLWDECLKQCGIPEVGAVLFVVGSVEEFREKQQIKFVTWKAAEESEFDLEDYIPRTARDIEEMWSAVESAIASLKNNHLRLLLNQFYQDKKFVKKFKNAPAAEVVHHAYLGGLLEHVWEMLEFSENVIKTYAAVDRDLLIAGILFHDIGKTEELGIDHSIYRTIPGNLLGHIVQGLNMVSKAIESCEKFPKELGYEVLHLIASHHGRLEFGSPVLPMTLEAIALNYLDELSSKIRIVDKLLADNKESEADFTEHLRFMENRKIYLK